MATHDDVESIGSSPLTDADIQKLAELNQMNRFPEMIARGEKAATPAGFLEAVGPILLTPSDPERSLMRFLVSSAEMLGVVSEREGQEMRTILRTWYEQPATAQFIVTAITQRMLLLELARKLKWGPNTAWER